MEKKNSSFAGFASFIALLIAAILFIVEYVVGITSGSSWTYYLAIARDIATAMAIVFGSWGYIRSKGLLMKLIFFAVIIVYVVFAFLVPLMG